LIEFIDSAFVYFFNLAVIYFVYKHSIHFLAFNEASVNERRTINPLVQFKNEVVAILGLMLRFYVLMFRLNMYDLLEDVLDSYYIFLGDFDEDEYLNEVIVSLQGVMVFTYDNLDDRSFLFEDEHDFNGDIYYLYYLV
jgi:hypothetical protein